MTERLAALLNDENSRGWFFAAIATVLAMFTLLNNAGPVSYSLLPIVVVLYVVDAIRPGWPSIAVVGVASIAVPIVLHLVGDDTETGFMLTILAIAIVAATETRREYVTAYSVTSMLLLVILGSTGALQGFQWLNWVIGCTMAWGLGALAFQYRAVIDELEATRSRMADQAALQERRRIARDVHDLVGHSLSVVLLHVTGARHLVRRDPDEAEAALAQAEAAGRESLAEIRHTVGLLRDDIEGEDGVEPAPDLGDIEAVVGRYRSAGMDVEYEAKGPLSEVEGSRAVAGYRIAQEALANVSKHTSGSRVRVRVAVDAAQCEVAVSNAGGRRIDSGSDSGYGMIGMRERAISVGGSLVAGPTREGWKVEAVFPRGVSPE